MSVDLNLWHEVYQKEYQARFSFWRGLNLGFNDAHHHAHQDATRAANEAVA